MGDAVPNDGPSDIDYQVLAAFRQSLRKIQHETDANAKASQITPQQHQALLVVKAGYPGKSSVTVTELAESLLLKHHSAVELTGRLAKAGLIRRLRSGDDRRHVNITLTPAGEALLASLSTSNFTVLQRAAPALRELLRMLRRHGFDDPGAAHP